MPLLVEQYAELFANKIDDKDFCVRLIDCAEKTVDKLRTRKSEQALLVQDLRWHLDTLRWLALNPSAIKYSRVLGLLVELLRRWLRHRLGFRNEMYEALELVCQIVEHRQGPTFTIQLLAPWFAEEDLEDMCLPLLFVAPLCPQALASVPHAAYDVPGAPPKKSRGGRGGRRAKNMPR